MTMGKWRRKNHGHGRTLARFWKGIKDSTRISKRGRMILLLVLFLCAVFVLGGWYPSSSLPLSPSSSFVVTTTTTTTTATKKSRHDECEKWTDELSSLESTFLDFNDRLRRTQWSSVLHEDDNSLKNNNNHTEKNPPLVIVFWHISKTGGTTIRSFFGQQQQQQQQQKWKNRMKMRLALKPGDFDRVSLAIQRHLQGQKTKKHDDDDDGAVLFVEFHGQGLEPHRWVEEMQLWRNLEQAAENLSSPSRQRRRRLFAFTLWRHPVDHAVSYYHYLVNHSDSMGNGLAQSPVFSRQCATFWMENEKKPPRRNHHAGQRNSQRHHPAETPWPLEAPAHSCWEAYQQLLLKLDWIGTTETIDTVTLPLLQRVVDHQYSPRNIISLPVSAQEDRDSTKPFRHQNVGTYQRTSSSNSSSTGRRAIDLKVQQWIEYDASCEDYAIWKKINASMEKIR